MDIQQIVQKNIMELTRGESV